MDDNNGNDDGPTYPGPNQPLFSVRGSGVTPAPVPRTHAMQPLASAEHEVVHLVPFARCPSEGDGHQCEIPRHPCEAKRHPCESEQRLREESPCTRYHAKATREIPPWLARVPQDLDLCNARSRPTGVARLMLALLWLHSNEHGVSWPGRSRLAWLGRTSEGEVCKALSLLRERGAVTRVTIRHRGRPLRAWQLRLEPPTDETAGLFTSWPEPFGAKRTNTTRAARAVIHGFDSRNHAAVILALYQSRARSISTAGCPASGSNPT